MNLSSCARLVLQLVGVTVVISFVTPLALAVLVVIVPPYYWYVGHFHVCGRHLLYATCFCVFPCPLASSVAQRYRWSARDLQRLESSTRSPIMALFNEARQGVVVIRAAGSHGVTLYMQRMYDSVSDNLRAFTYFWAANQWVTVGSFVRRLVSRE